MEATLLEASLIEAKPTSSRPLSSRPASSRATSSRQVSSRPASSRPASPRPAFSRPTLYLLIELPFHPGSSDSRGGRSGSNVFPLRVRLLIRIVAECTFLGIGPCPSKSMAPTCSTLPWSGQRPEPRPRKAMCDRP